MPQTLDISFKTIVKIFLAGFIFYVLFLVRHILVWLFFALVISLLAEPAVNFLKKFHLPKFLSVAAVYLSIFGILGFIIYLISPVFIFEFNQFMQNAPVYFEKINPWLKNFGFDFTQNFQNSASSSVEGLKESSMGIFKAVSVFFGGFLSAASIFALAFFISLEERGPERVLTILSPQKYEELVLSIFQRVQYKVAGWFGVRILASLFLSVISFFIFFFLGIKYALTFAFLSGLFSFVPFIGPLFMTLLVTLFAGISDSWATALYVAVALTLIYEMESKIVTPLLLKKFLDLPPVLVLLSLFVGGTIFGVLGIIFIIPVFGIIYEFSKEFLEKRKAAGEAVALSE